MNNSKQRPLGVFDSGIGGLSVVLEIQQKLPFENILYFADSQHCPYGPRTEEDIRDLTTRAASFLVNRGCKVMVIACNTASAVSLVHLRAIFDIQIVGLEPALKPAAQRTRNGNVGVLATVTTIRGHPLRNLTERFGDGLTVTALPCPGLVEQIETGEVEGPVIEKLLAPCLSPMTQGGVDTLVLGCTHYPFAAKTIARLMGSHVTIIDSGAAVAQQVRRVLERQNDLRPEIVPGKIQAFTSGDPEEFGLRVGRLLGYRLAIQGVTWDGQEWQVC